MESLAEIHLERHDFPRDILDCKHCIKERIESLDARVLDLTNNKADKK